MKINVIIQARLLTDKLAEARSLLDTLSRETRREDGCELYRFALDGEQLMLAERWRSQADLDHHLQTPHFLACLPPLKACCVEGVLHAEISHSESVTALSI